MTKDELKTRLADVLEHPDNADALVKDLDSDLDLLEASKETIAEQNKTIEEYQTKEKQDAINSLLTAPSKDTPKEEEQPKKTPKEEFKDLFNERYYSDDEKGKELRHGSN